MSTAEYNPYEHRELSHPNSVAGAIIHIVKGSLGSGLMAVPRAFRHAGLAVGFIGTILIGVGCTYAVHLLVAASKKVCADLKVPSLGFAETAQAVFEDGPENIKKYSKYAKVFVEISLVLTHFVGLAVYVVLVSDSIAKFVEFYHTPAGKWGNYFKLILLVFLIFCCQVKELKHLVPFSFIANLTMMVALGLTGYYMISDVMEVNINERRMSGKITGLPSFFCTIIFAMEGIGTIMPVENSMVEDKFIGCPSVLNVSMAMVVILYTVIGFLGYYAYGEETEAMITQNLPYDEILAQVVQLSISLAIFFTFMLQYYVPIDITWRTLKPYVSEKKQRLVEIALRSVIVCFIVGIAAAAGDNLGPLIDLLGAVFFSTLGLFIPAFLDIIVHWKNWGKCNWMLIQDSILIFFFLFGLTFGSYYAVLNFVNNGK